MDLTTLTDEELDNHRREVLTEVERRERVTEAPVQVAALARSYAADGGDVSVLVDAIGGAES